MRTSSVVCVGMSITPEQLERWCRDYDISRGEWPETKLEGWSVWRYIKARSEGATIDWDAWPEKAPDGWDSEVVTAQAERDRG